MKKHLLAALSLSILATLPACFGCCDKKETTTETKTTEASTEVAAVEANVVEMPATDASVVPAEEVKS